MNYKEMSDVDIAAATLEHAGYKMIDDGDRYAIYNSKSGRKDIGEKASAKFKFDPCNNPSDACPIIFSSRIMLNPYCADELWKAEVPCGFDGFVKAYATCYHRNPLRAAMIVFLMMEDAKNAD